MSFKLNLSKDNLLIKADDEFKLFKEAYRKSRFELAYKHLINALKLKTICAYNTSTSNPVLKSKLYLEASRLAAMAGYREKQNFLLTFSKCFGLETRAYYDLHCLAISAYPSVTNDKFKYICISNKSSDPINVGDVLLLDEVRCRVAFKDPRDDISATYIDTSSDYAICISYKFCNKIIFYLISARKFICEDHDLINIYGVNVGADFNFMPSVSE